MNDSCFASLFRKFKADRKKRIISLYALGVNSFLKSLDSDEKEECGFSKYNFHLLTKRFVKEEALYILKNNMNSNSKLNLTKLLGINFFSLIKHKPFYDKSW